MSSTQTMPHSSRPILSALADGWWVLLLRGIAGIVFGILALMWPGLTLLLLVVFYGAWALVDGALALYMAITGRGGPIPSWWLVVVGLAGLVAGALTFFWPGVTALVLVLFIGAWALISGIFQIIGAIQLRKEIDNEWMLILGGVVSVLFGIGVLIVPGAGALALIWVIAFYSILFGILTVAAAFKLKKHKAA